MDTTANGVRVRFHNNFITLRGDAPPLLVFDLDDQGKSILVEVNFDGYIIKPIEHDVEEEE